MRKADWIDELEQPENIDIKIGTSGRGFRLSLDIDYPADDIQSDFRDRIDEITGYRYGRVESETSTTWTRTHLEKVQAVLDEIDGQRWRDRLTAFKRTKEYRDWLREEEILEITREAVPADLGSFGGDNYSKGDHLTTNRRLIADLVHRAKDLRKYHSAGDLLALVTVRRKRVYAKSSKWGPSTTEFCFLVGRNENGNPFAHGVPHTVETVAEAWDWIWGGADIEARQGDVALAGCRLKHVDGEHVEQHKIPVGHGTHSHEFSGEIRENGALYVRDGILEHPQHDAVEVGDDWMRVVIGNRSSQAASSSD